MDQALSAVLIAAASIVTAVTVAMGAYAYAMQIPDAPLSALQSKIYEIGAAVELASLGQRAAAHGVCTGRLVMTCQEISPFNITVVMPGGIGTIAATKIALAVNGVEIAVAPSENFTFGAPSMKVLSSAGRTFAAPVASISSAEAEGELGAKIRTVVVKIPMLAPSQAPFRASGTFSLWFAPNGTRCTVHTFEANAGGTASVLIDGVSAMSFDVSAGEKLRVSVEYLLIALTRL